MSLGALLCPTDKWSPVGSDAAQDFNPCFAAWVIRTALPIGAALLCFAVYLLKYQTRPHTSGTGGAPYLPIPDSLPQGQEDENDTDETVLASAVLEGGILVPAEGARALAQLNSTRSLLRSVLTALLSCNVFLLAAGAAAADNSMTLTVELLHTLFGASVLAAATTIPASRIFPLVLVLAADAFSALVQLRSALLDAHSVTTAHALPIASAITILSAFAVALVEYNRITHVKSEVLLALHPSVLSDDPESSSSAADETDKPAPMTLEPFASLVQRATFGWFTPLVKKGFKTPLELADIWDLAVSDKSVAATREYATHVRPGRATWVAVALTNKWLLAYQITAGVGSSALAFASPYFLNRLLDYLEHRQSLPGVSFWEPYWYVLGLFVCKTMASVCDGQTYFTGRRVGTRTRAIINSLLFRKTLTRNAAMTPEEDTKKTEEPKKSEDASTDSAATDAAKPEDAKKSEDEEDEEEKDKTRETDVNVLIGTDMQRIIDYVCYIQYLFMTPIQLVTCIAALYLVLGWSAFTGVAILAIMIPIQSRLGQVMEGKQEKLMAATDARVKKMTEVLQGIRIVKYFALEAQFEEMIQKLRANELNKLRTYWLVMCAVNVTYHAVPTIVTLLTFICYAAIGNELDATTVFTAISLFAVLRMPLWDLPDQIIRYFETKVSVVRIQNYLAEPDVVDYTIDTSDIGLAISTSSPSEPNKPTGYGSFADHHSIYIGARAATLCWPVGVRPETAAAATAAAAAAADVSAQEKSKKVSGTADETQSLLSDTATAVASSSAAASGSASTSTAFHLHDVNVSFPRGKLSVILGPTGSGKSTLLHAILGELELVGGQVFMPRVPVAYVPQQSWLMNATVKENICFHAPCDAERYNKVIHACALTRDLEILDGGDATQIGEKGVALSGGQKQRVSLARATYARDTDIIVLDDVLSAVDAPTAAHLFNECIQGEVMEGKTRILVSHNVGLVAPHADFIVYVKDGRLVAQGNSMAEVIQQLLANGFATEADALIEVATPASSHRGSSSSADKKKGKNAKKDEAASADKDKTEADAPARQAGQLIKDEEKAVGAVDSQVYVKYMLASGGLFTWVIIIAGIFVPQLLNVMQDWWLKTWAQSYTTEAANPIGATVATAEHPSVSFMSMTIRNVLAANEDPAAPKVDLGYYMSVYVALCVVNVVIQYGFNVFEVYANLRAAVSMHNAMLKRVLGAPISFFDSTPTGRLVNRFSRDMQTVDREVLGSIAGVVWCLSSVLLVIGMVSVISPMFLLFVAPLSLAYRAIAAQYLASSRELKRLESVTRSPIFSIFQETAAGTSVVRAYRRQHEFQRKAERRMDIHHRPFFALWVSNRWLSVRLDGLSNIVIAACGIAILVSGNLYAGTAGIALTWVQGISDSSLWLVRIHATMEMNAVSVERISEYSEVEQETQGGESPTHWPTRGDLKVHNLTMKYPSSTTPVLRGVSFSVPGKSKVGVVGRTGAGKSSLALALLRMLEAEDGYVEIDGVRTRDVSLHTLRSRVTMVPQDPVLFEGTLRSNLDVLGEFDDATCWNALERVHFFESAQQQKQQVSTTASSVASSASSIASDSNADDAPTVSAATAVSAAATSNWTLDSAIAAGGKNLSVGQRQLLALARALVRRSKVIIMDESTANVSHDLDAKIQVTVRDEFKDSTILVIAHRLRTVCDFDKILVLDQGQVVEFGSPYELISRDQGTFRHMCSESGEFDHLLTMARRAAAAAGESVAPLPFGGAAMSAAALM